MRWYRKILSAGKVDQKDLSCAIDASDAYLALYEEARDELTTYQGKLERISSQIAGIAEHRFAQLQELEAILQYLEEREKVVRIEKTKHYMEHYQRTLTERVARDYAEAHDDVQAIRMVIHEVSYVRNLFSGITKSVEYLHFQISNVTKLRCAGVEDSMIDMRR